MKHPSPIDFNRAPFLLIWETTQACALACQHCRAEAANQRDPRELNLEEGKNLISDTARMGTPIIIFSGGDPLQREDLEDLIRYAREKGLRTGAIPAATERLVRERVQRLKEAGLEQMALSLDGATPESHDTFRQVSGSFAKTMEGAKFVHEAGIPLQINTCFGSWNFSEFEAIRDLVISLDIVFWEVFFLVPTGRGSSLQGLDAEGFEKLFTKLYDTASRASFIIKVTEAPHYRRFILEREKPRQLHWVNAGKGFCFVSHTGEVYPSGFLPLSAGNVRAKSVIDLYRNAPIFRELRDPALLKGRCGACEYREICGGSRSRAHAMTGDYLAEDPCCIYKPSPQPLSLSEGEGRVRVGRKP